MNVELLKHILDYSNRLSATYNITQVLKMAIDASLEIVQAELAYLVTVDEQGELHFIVHTRVDTPTDAKAADDLSRTILNEVLQTHHSVVITDALSDERYSTKSSIKNLQCRSVMCVPLVVSGKAIGALYVENRTIKGAFRQEDLEPLIIFANQAAVSIENARIIATLELRVQERTAELEQSWQSAVESNRLRTTMLGQLTHDMRNSISVVSLSIDMLNKLSVGNLNEHQHRLVERADYAVDQIAALVDNLFNLSKSELQSLDIHVIDTDMNRFLEQMQTIGAGLPWRDHVTFRADVDSNLPQLTIDPVRIQQVIMNLLSNAQKFTHEGYVELYAKHNDSNKLVIGVKDTGSGIPAEHQPYIFERYKQFDTDAAQQAKGGGFGLAICKELVEKHGGRIHVESTPTVGSDFWFTLQ